MTMDSNNVQNELKKSWIWRAGTCEFPMWASTILFFVLPYVAFYLLEAFSHKPFEMNAAVQLTNYFVLFAIQCLFFALFRTIKRAVIGMSIVAYVVGLVNYLVLSFRGTPIMPWDYKSLGTAISVAENYSFPWSREFAVSSLLFALILVLAAFMQGEIRYRTLRLVSIASMTALFLGVISLINYPVYADMIKLNNTLFTPTYMYKQNGFSVAFIRNFTYLKVPEPAGYSIDRVNDIMDEYMDGLSDSIKADGSVRRYGNGVWLALRDDLVAPGALYAGNEMGNGQINSTISTTNYDQASYVRGRKGQPNVVVVMNEAFAELAVLAEYRTNADYMPFINSMDENVIRGYLHASIIGGNTATSEFEFLTSDSMAFLPSGSVAYQQFVVGSMPTLNQILEDQGYHSVAMHPYNASGWERDTVYPYFGFDRIKFAPDFKNRHRVRDYISDRSLFNEILLELENSPEDRPSFIFTVSMQNHGGFSKRFDDFPVNVEIMEEGNFNWINHYLSLIQETDRALEEFLGQLEKLEEETIVLFFGDHQPNNSTVSALQKLDSYSEDPTARNIVPYLMWANFDIGEHNGRTTSMNYLAGDLLSAAGLEGSPYMSFLNDLQDEIPVITADYYILKDGSTYFFNEDEQPEDPRIQDLINQYEVLQYNHLIDLKNRVDEIFSIANSN